MDLVRFLSWPRNLQEFNSTHEITLSINGKGNLTAEARPFTIMTLNLRRELATIPI